MSKAIDIKGYNFHSLGEDQYIEIDIDHKNSLLSKILDELQEDVIEDVKEDGLDLSLTGLSFKGDLQKKTNSTWRDFVLLVGELKGVFYTQCIKSGEIIIENLSVDIQAIFLNETLQKSQNLDEVDSLFIEDYEYDLYFFKGPKVNIFDVLNEQAFLHKDPYPTKKAKEEGIS